MNNSKLEVKPQKISIFSKIIIKKTQIIDKIKEKYKKSDDVKSFMGMIFDITLFSILLGLSYLAFVTPSIYLKALGFGCLFWMVSNKIVPLLIAIFSSLKLFGGNK